MDMLNDIPPPLRADRNTNKFIPLQARLQLKRNALKRLPELTNAPQFINAKEQSSLAQKHSLAQNPALFKASNPLFVVNTLFGTFGPTQKS
jgi:hypothetical protein